MTIYKIWAQLKYIGQSVFIIGFGFTAIINNIIGNCSKKTMTMYILLLKFHKWYIVCQSLSNSQEKELLIMRNLLSSVDECLKNWLM